jgi:hypothetical protein
MPTSRYAALDRASLAKLVPELLLLGQLIDRAGMPWLLSFFDRQRMQDIAIEEWMAASPIYTRRMQRALGYTGDDIITIFKGLQLDVGAPPQFMDFRFEVDDPQHGAFWLNHCGALMDVEPMGEDYVRGMCHDIEDPTFDATAVATNPKAQVRPVHRPPRVPADQHPHCRWTVIIDESHPPVSESKGCLELQRTRAANVELDPIDPDDEGRSDYSGPLMADLDFTAFSRSALIRIADEVALQCQLLALGFQLAVSQRGTDEQNEKILGKQLIGITGVSGDRISDALGITDPIELIQMLPMLNPAALVSISDPSTEGSFRIDFGDLNGWADLPTSWWAEALSAAVHTLDPHLAVQLHDDHFRVIRHDEAQPERSEVEVTRYSKGAEFTFEPRLSLPVIQVT